MNPLKLNKLNTNVAYSLGGALMSLCFMSAQGYAIAADNPPGVNAYPIIYLFDRSDGEGEACHFDMTPGKHKFGRNYPCKNDWAESFWIESPRDGIRFSIHDNTECSDSSQGRQYYKIMNPEYGPRTASVSVSAASHNGRGKEVTKGIWAVDFGGDRVEGKVSCLNVEDDG